MSDGHVFADQRRLLDCCMSQVSERQILCRDGQTFAIILHELPSRYIFQRVGGNFDAGVCKLSSGHVFNDLCGTECHLLPLLSNGHILRQIGSWERNRVFRLWEGHVVRQAGCACENVVPIVLARNILDSHRGYVGFHMRALRSRQVFDSYQGN